MKAIKKILFGLFVMFFFVSCHSGLSNDTLAKMRRDVSLGNASLIKDFAKSDLEMLL
jgi:hypothetical protein